MARKKRVIEGVEAIDIGDKGKVIARTAEGEIVMVDEGCVPGDVIDFIYMRKKKGLKAGKVKRIVKESEWRVDPFCEHFGVCGGCKWQNLDYQKQIELKERSVINAIKRIAKDDESKVDSILGCEQTERYRNKLEYTFSTKRWLTDEEIASGEDFSSEGGAVGFHRAGVFDKVVPIDQCHLQNDLTNIIRNRIAEIAKTHDMSFYNIKGHEGFLRNVILRNTIAGEWMLTMIFGEHDEEKRNKLFDILIAEFPQVISWNYMINTKMNSSTLDLQSQNYAGVDHIKESLGDITYRISPKSFFQTNSTQAKHLYDVAKEYAELEGGEVLYDLYTGTGSIAIYMSSGCDRVVGIEEVPEAIADAKLNAQDNQIENTTFLVGDVKEVLKPSFREEYGAPDVVVTDPPRAGMHPDVVETILELSPPKIVYISCNPSTQARDILLLKEKYELVKVKPVDMFPHTSHIESVALLKKK